MEISSHRQLEHSPAVCLGVALAEPGALHPLPCVPHPGVPHPLREPPLELLATLRRHGGGRDQRQSLDPLGVLDCIQHGEQPPPGVSEQRGWCQAPARNQGVEVGDLLTPPDGHLPLDRRPAAAPLVVVPESPPSLQGIELWKEVVVMCPRPAVENHDVRTGADGSGEE